jgi:hypothetical protein
VTKLDLEWTRSTAFLYLVYCEQPITPQRRMELLRQVHYHPHYNGGGYFTTPVRNGALRRRPDGLEELSAIGETMLSRIETAIIATSL